MIWLWIYIVVGVVLLVPFNRLLMRTEFMGDMAFDAEDRFMAWVMTVFGAAFWPLIGGSIIAIGLSRFIWSFFDKPKVKR